MSFLLRVDKEGAEYRPTKTARPIPVYVDEKKLRLLVGYAYEGKAQELLDCGWENDIDAINRFDGSIALVSWGGKTILYADVACCDKVYYYHGDHFLLVSDHFWDIVRAIEPGFDDLDQDDLRVRMVMQGAQLNSGTVIKGLSLLLPGSRVEYDAEADRLQSKVCRYFRFSGEISDVDEAVEQLSCALDMTMQRIKERYGNVTYGIGLSGGLDSRMALHYALKNGMKVSCFNICKKRPNGVLLARSVRLAQKIADLYSVPLTLVEWDPKQIDKVKAIQTKQYTDGGTMEAPRDIYKYVPDWKPEFDVLLTGGMGTALIGGSHFPEEETVELCSTAKYIEETMIFRYGRSLFNQGMHALFGIPLKKVTYRYSWEKKLFGTPHDEIHTRVVEALKDILANRMSYFETLYNFRSRYLTFYGCNGAFESMFCQLPAHSIYSTYVVKEGVRCSTELMQNRGIARALISKKIPAASQIAEEGHDAPPAKINSFRFLRKGFALADRLLRGDGSHVAGKYWRSPEVWKSFEADMKNDCKWFWQVMDVDIPFAEVRRAPDTDMSSIWDTKRLLDALETKAYMNWDA